jgi:hypothetical protein
MKSENIKQNINFLEYPLWFQDDIAAANAEQGMIWKDREAYVYKAGYKTPVKTDAIILLYLLMQSQRNGYNQELTLTRYQILNDCSLDVCAKSYARLEDSLRRWKMVGIEFSGTFYDGESYSAINFGIIDSWSIHKQTKELKVTFSPSFIKMMLGKGFFQYINFTEFKKLRSPLATRLYEILCKSFHGREIWEINAVKMAEKIPMKERYPAHIVPKIKTAVSRINNCSDTKFLLETRKLASGQTILCFTKTTAEKPLLQANQPKNETVTIPNNPEISSLITLLPEQRQAQKTILEAVIAFYKTHGSDYVDRNIRYTNKNAKSNYRTYLLKALKQDYGLAMKEDEDIQQKIIAQQKLEKQKLEQQKAAEQERLRIEQENKKRVKEYIASLPEEEKLNLKAQALADMSETNKAIVLKNGTGAKSLLNIEIEKIALKKLNDSKSTEAILTTFS